MSIHHKLFGCLTALASTAYCWGATPESPTVTSRWASEKGAADSLVWVIEGDYRPVSSAWMLEVGSSHLLDSYLSPLKYTGWSTALSYERTQAMKFYPQRWTQQLNLSVLLDRGENPSGNASQLYGNLHAAWSMSHRWTLRNRLWVSAGGEVQGNFGGVYSSRNGNNPASVKADVDLGVVGACEWSFHLKNKPIRLRWQTAMPLLGAMFSPEYDELYYEIYLGNNHGLAHCAWPGNMFRWDNLLTGDIAFGNTQLRVGFRSRIYSSEVNHITTRNFSYAFVVGVVTDWISVKPKF